MTVIRTLTHALQWLQSEGWNTDFRSPEPELAGARRIDQTVATDRYGQPILHYCWCRTDAEVIDFACEQQCPGLEEVAPDLLAACERLVLAFDVGDVAHTTLNGRGHSALSAVRAAIAKAYAAPSDD